MAIRCFVSHAELEVSEMLDYLHINHEKYRYICFRCAHMGNVRVERSKHDKRVLRILHPTKCDKCSQQFGLCKFQFSEPDEVLFAGSNSKKSIIYVNGIDHQKDRVIEKDMRQIEILRKLGYKVFTIEVEYLSAYKKELLDYLCDCYLATANDDLYLKMCHKPKVGLLNHSTFENWLDQKITEL